MRSIYSLLTVFLLSCFVSLGAYADSGDFMLQPCNNSEKNVTRVHFDTPLDDSEQWTITAETRYFGEPSNTTWGSRLFHAYLCEKPIKISSTEPCGGEDNSTNEFTSESKLCFYMRPPVGYPGGTTNNAGKLLLANNVNNTPDVLNIDTQNGTLFTFQIISDGTGTVLVNIWVEGNNNGEPYTKTYTNHEIGTVYGLAAGSNYGVEATVTLGASKPILTKPGDVDFRWVLLEKTATKSITVRGVNVAGNITGTIDGTDKTAFNLTTASAPNDGDLVITFTPDAARVYNAQLVLSAPNAEPVEINLKGEGTSVFPVNPDDSEAFYYVQFVRRGEEAKVWTAIPGDSIAQAILTPGNDLQLWRVEGDWDEYYFVNKTGNYELSYDIERDKYLTAATQAGEPFGFVRYKDTQDWQVQNLEKTYADPESGASVSSKNYINDYQGRAICSYSIDDTGNQIVFIPTTAQKLFAGPDSIGFAKAPIGNSSSKKQPVVALNLPAFTYSLDGPDKAAFSIEQTADTLNITFAPDEPIDYNALLTITAGSQSHAIKLAGTGVKLPFKVSSETTAYWYQIQFDRNDETRGKAIQDNGQDAKLAQETKVEGQSNQLWKITGTWDNYKLIAQSGREMKSNANPSTGDSRYVAGAAGTGHVFRLEEGNNGRWELYDKTLTGGNRYVNDNGRTEVGSWSDNDIGNALNFLPNFANIGANDLAFYDVEQGATLTKELTVTSAQLTADISFVLESSADAAAFTVTAIEDEEDDTPALAPGTLYKEGGKLRITFTPTEKRAYSAKLILSSGDADNLEVRLTGTADFNLPVIISNGATEEWYFIQFKRKPDNYLSTDAAGYVVQITKDPAEPEEALHWKFTGSVADGGYQIVNASGSTAYFNYEPELDSLYKVRAGEGDKHQFVRANNGADWQLYNLTIEGPEGRYLNEFQGKGQYASLYGANDAGNYLIFTPVRETAIYTPEPVEEVIVATRYYTLQGMEVKKPTQTGIYIKQDIYASKRVKASKVYILVK
jgi:muconolactone delta-isomerase